jgi:hypothetical protein
MHRHKQSEREREREMKKFFMILLGKFAKAHVKDIKKAQKWIDSAQAQFASAIEEAELAEQSFAKVEDKKREQIEEALQELNEIAGKKDQAIKFKNKIKQFIEE